MEDEKYFPVPTGAPGARWAASFWISGRWLKLVENSWLEDEGDAAVVLRALHLQVTRDTLDHHFPRLKGKRRCPTLDLLELCAAELRGFRGSWGDLSQV